MANQDFENQDQLGTRDRRQEEGPGFSDIMSVVWLNKWWFALSIFVCIMLGVLYIWMTPKTYSRSATVMIKDDKNGGSAGSEASAFQDMLQFGNVSAENELGFFKSNRLMLQVVEKTGADKSYSAKSQSGLRLNELYTQSPVLVTLLDVEPDEVLSFTMKVKGGGRVEICDMEGLVKSNKKLTVTEGDTVDTPICRMVLRATVFMNPGWTGKEIFFSKSSTDDVAKAFSENLEASITKGSSLITLSLKDVNAMRAEDVLNTLIQVYQADAINDKNQVVRNTAKFLDDHLSVIEGELGGVDTRIESYMKANNLTDVSSNASLYLQNTGNLDNQGLGAENQLNMAEYIQIYLQDNSKTNELIPAATGISDSGIQSQINDYNAALLRRDKLAANSSVNNPLVQDLNNQLSSMRATITKAVNNQVEVLKIQVRNLNKMERENQSRISSVPTQQKNVVSIEREQKTKEEMYLYLLQKKQENELQYAINESNCRIVDPAIGPVSPVAPRKATAMLVALLIGLAIPALWLYFASVSDTTVKTKKDVKEGVTIPFLGEIPMEKRKFPQDIVVREGSREGVCEAFKIARNNLDFMDAGKKMKCKVLQVTSLYPDAGKSFVSVNLAMSMALGGSKVMILDLDLRKGTLRKSLDIQHRHGLSEYLSGKTDDYASMIHPVKEGFPVDVLLSGALPPNPAELLNNGRIEELMDGLRSKYDFIIMDNPPYGTVVDASVCAKLADQTVFVIRSGMFDRRVLPDLQELYDSGKLHDMGIILNAIDYRKIVKKYGYGYGHYGYGNYGYGYGYGEKTDDGPVQS